MRRPRHFDANGSRRTRRARRYWKGDPNIAGGRVRADDERACATRAPPPDAPANSRLQRWAERLEARGHWHRADWYTHAHSLPAQLGGEVFAPRARDAPARRAIDGELGWNSTDSPEHRRAAARLLVANADALARFAGRGCRRARQRRASDARSAPLADPDLADACPDDALATIDALLRIIAAELLDPDAAPISIEGAPAAPAAAVIGYLRDRVGVPRDCAHPVAHELRAQLSALRGRLLEAG